MVGIDWAEKHNDVCIIDKEGVILARGRIAAGYEVFAINPMSVDRYRDRHSTSGAKSDLDEAKVLADIVRTDRHNHRQVAGDSELADAGTSPITRASGTHRVVLARYARNERLFNACYLWAFASLTTSPPARAYCDRESQPRQES